MKKFITLISDNNSKFLKYKFWGIVFVVLVVVVSTFSDYGITGDEYYSRFFGETNLKFYTTLGASKGFMPTSLNIYQNTINRTDANNIVHYPSLIDMLEYGIISNMFNGKYKVTIPHLVNALIGVFLFIIVGLLTKELSNWRGAILALLLIILTPKIYGEIFNNPKDIPFAAFYVFSLYCFIRWVKSFPRFEAKKTIWLWISLGLALGVRSVAFVMFANVFILSLLYFRVHQKEVFNDIKFSFYFKKVLKILVLGYLLGIFFWPYALINPFTNAISSFFTVSQYPVIIQTLFDGVKIRSDQIPYGYLIKWIFISTPLLFTFGIAFFTYSSFKKKKIPFTHVIILFSIILPLILIIVGKSNLYNSWRQAYFLYPPLVVLAGLGIHWFLGKMEEKVFYIKYAVIIIGFFFPLKYALTNHPYQSVYFNSLYDSKEKVFGKYETDYYGNSLKKSFDWLYENEIKGKKKGKVTVATNYTPSVLSDYVKHIDTNVKIAYVRYQKKNNVPFDYYIINTQLIIPDIFLHQNPFPTYTNIKTFYVNNIPISWIQKKSNDYNVEASNAYDKKDFELAYKKAKQFYDIYPTDFDNTFLLLLCSSELKKPADTFRLFFSAVENIAPQSPLLLLFKANMFVKKSKFNEAEIILKTLIEKQFTHPTVPYLYSIILRRKGYEERADYYLQLYQKMQTEH